uniref:Glutenin, high molecular weight subunit DX5-like n=1 Tax=Crassostrea virginica TaxID=6565 RepID=A0A8B8CFL3_CRAVI
PARKSTATWRISSELWSAKSKPGRFSTPGPQLGGFPPNQGQQPGVQGGGVQPGGFPPQGQQPGNFPTQIDNQGGGFNQAGQQPGAFPNQNQGAFPPQNQGAFPPQNQGAFPPQNQGAFPPQNQGGFPAQGQAAGPTANMPGLGGFQPNAIGGFGSVGNRFGNPFVPGNVVGNNLPGAGGGNNPNQFTASGQLFMSLSQNPNNYRYATCYFNSTENSIRGRADFRQFLFGDSGVDIRIQVVGLPTSPVDTQRGIHIHEFGDTGERCSRVGPHFNPTQTRHGGRNSYPFLRHVGDLGNMLQSAQGVASTQFRDEVISLQGQGSILGRSLVVKLERDDEGTGTNSASQQNGNARTPIACCTIGRASPANWRTPYSEDDLMVMSGGAWSPNTGSNSAPGLQGSPAGLNPQGTQTNPLLNQGASTNTQGTQTGFNAQGAPAAGGNSFNAAGGSQFGNNFGGGSNSGQSSFGFLGNQGK